MLRIGVDFGASRVKAAVSENGGEPVILVFSDGRDFLPTLLWVPVGSDALHVGARAESRLAVSELEMVTSLKAHLGESAIETFDARDGMREVAPRTLAARLLAEVIAAVRQRHGIAANEQPPVVLTAPRWMIRAGYERVLAGAAADAGFGPVEIMDEPVAAGRWFLSGAAADAESVLVVDVGHGSTDMAVVSRGEDGTCTHDISAGVHSMQRGAHHVDQALVGLLATRLRSDAEAAGEDGEPIRRQLDRLVPWLDNEARQMREALAAGASTEVLSWRGFRAHLDTVDLGAAARQELAVPVRDMVAVGMDRQARLWSKRGLEPDIPILLCGGGLVLGLAEALESLGRRVITPNHPAHAAALGAAWGGDQASLAGPEPQAIDIQLAAEQGNAVAQYVVGVNYFIGKGVKQDFSRCLVPRCAGLDLC